MRVAGYLNSCLGLGILLKAKYLECLSAFCDADWSSCPNIMKSATGYLVKFGDSLISWKSKKQSTIFRSSTELEYCILASTVPEVIWILGLFKESGVAAHTFIPLYCDSKSAIKIDVNLVFHERAKHIEIDCHFIR